ncbi:MAG: alpha-1,2-fucosyltransferase [Alphaproteobacteria bacterium]|nr:alpha-1,2-fucosyltransferase [Alphaproteobacteria bacterium]
MTGTGTSGIADEAGVGGGLQSAAQSGTVTVHIYGGLGNQMFQYACGRALALRHGAGFRIDSRDFSAGPGQTFGLQHFNIVRDTGVDEKLPPSKRQRLRYLMWRYLKRSPKFIRESGTVFDPDILDLKSSCVLHGYWQSERYFEDFADQIRNELSIATPASETNRQMLAEIAGLPAVSLHLRRGDYVSNPKALKYHGTCSQDYYRSAARHVAEIMPLEPIFFVFSDEPEWAKDHLDLPFETRIVDHNDSFNNYEDMRLMASCNHNIIANSSFSWWGAWLNPSPEKIVVAPANWVSDPAHENPHITPKSWLRFEG